MVSNILFLSAIYGFWMGIIRHGPWPSWVLPHCFYVCFSWRDSCDGNYTVQMTGLIFPNFRTNCYRWRDFCDGNFTVFSMRYSNYYRGISNSRTGPCCCYLGGVNFKSKINISTTNLVGGIGVPLLGFKIEGRPHKTINTKRDAWLWVQNGSQADL